ncbi:MAG: VWA domain-containing protein [Acidobacteriota bacterium]|nr:MAG: VWA domain-containing protein [Acidobacteriota bacterium]
MSTMTRVGGLSALAIGLSLIGLAGAGAQVEPSTEPPSEATEPIDAGFGQQVEVALVLIEAVVVDRDGQHVRGLSREDFEVRESGRKVRILTFDEVELPTLGREPRPPREPAVADVSAPGPPSEGPEALETAEEPSEPPTVVSRAITDEDRRRTIVLLFDGYYNASALHLVQARRAAQKFVRKKMRPGDLAVAYELTPFLRAVTGASMDAEQIASELENVRYYGGESLGESITDSTVYGGYLGSKQQIEDRMKNSARFGAKQASIERRKYMEGLESLGEALEALPGRKVVLLFSGGMPLLLADEDMSSGGFDTNFRRVLRQYEKSRTSIYSMNIGEDPALVDASQRSTYRDTLDYLGFGSGYADDLGRGIGMGGGTSAAYNQLMAVLAHETGGRFFAGRNYTRALEAMDEDTQHYYLIGYEPLPWRGIARHRTIDIDVAGKGLRVHARRGRFRPSPDERAAVQAERTSPGSDTRRAAGSTPGSSASERRLSCSPIFFPGRTGKTLVSLVLRFDEPLASAASGQRAAALHVTSQVIARAEGTEVGRSDHGFDADFSSDALGKLERGVRLLEGLEVPPGTVELEARVRVEGLGGAANFEGSCHERFEVPAIDAAAFAISGLAHLADESTPPLIGDAFAAPPPGKQAEASSEDPFRLGNGYRVLPSGSSAIAPSEPTTIFFRVYGAEIDPATGFPRGLQVHYTLVPESGGAAILPPAEVGYFDAADATTGAFDMLVQLHLDLVEPGSYRLRVEATDGSEQRRASREWPLEVVTRPKS